MSGMIVPPGLFCQPDWEGLQNLIRRLQIKPEINTTTQNESWTDLKSIKIYETLSNKFGFYVKVLFNAYKYITELLCFRMGRPAENQNLLDYSYIMTMKERFVRKGEFTDSVLVVSLPLSPFSLNYVIQAIVFLNPFLRLFAA